MKWNATTPCLVRAETGLRRRNGHGRRDDRVVLLIGGRWEGPALHLPWGKVGVRRWRKVKRRGRGVLLVHGSRGEGLLIHGCRVELGISVLDHDH